MDVQLRIRSSFSEVTEAVQILAPLLEGFVSDDTAIKVEIGLHEVINNIIEHGYGRAQDQQIHLWARRRRNIISILIEDQGRPHPATYRRVLIEPEKRADLEDMSERGRGLWLIEQCFSRIRYRGQEKRNQTLIRIIGDISAEAAAQL